jgi:hypothetical protein
MLRSRQGTNAVVGLLQRSAPSLGRTQNTRRRLLSGWNQRGHDLTSESLAFGGGSRPKVILQGYGPSGFDVFNMVKKMDARQVSNGTLHMHVSLMLCIQDTSNQPLCRCITSHSHSFVSSPATTYNTGEYNRLFRRLLSLESRATGRSDVGITRPRLAPPPGDGNFTPGLSRESSAAGNESHSAGPARTQHCPGKVAHRQRHGDL